MAGMNQALAPEIETVFLASSPGGAAHRGESRPPDCRHGGRRFVLRAEGRGRGPQQEVCRLSPVQFSKEVS